MSLTLLSRPSPTPSQAGRLSLVWVHANCQGMALRDSMPPVGFLFAGLWWWGYVKHTVTKRVKNSIMEHTEAH